MLGFPFRGTGSRSARSGHPVTDPLGLSHAALRQNPDPVHRVRDPLKHASLLVPVNPAGNGPQVSLVEALEERQKEDLFLDVRSQIDVSRVLPRNCAGFTNRYKIDVFLSKTDPFLPNLLPRAPFIRPHGVGGGALGPTGSG
jgi:hypothetical protein